MKHTEGIHHITAIVGHPQENVDFYSGVLGLRLIKKTVNFDDPETYHLYFGNESGDPGTIITFFPWADGRPGKTGGGQVGTTTYAVPAGALPFWEKRLRKFGIKTEASKRFGETFLQFDDVHGLHLELVEREGGPNKASTSIEIASDQAIQGFAGAVLYSFNPEKTMLSLEKTLGLERMAEENGFVRFKSHGELGNVIDVKNEAVRPGRMGVGTVHHIAWRAKDDKDQIEWKALASEHGYAVTPVRDRNYFNAIYFREHGGNLFEIATDPPGFAIDESPETMGSELKLPPQYEADRDRLEKVLIPIQARTRSKEQ